jgi:predicted CXXCH cytochrome family protein
MKKFLFLGIGSALIFTMGGVGPAQADNGPHIANGPGTSVTPDGCAGCHRVHSAKTDMLTIDVQPTLCYACHGAGATGATTDVQDGVGFAPDANGKRTATPAGALRGGGFENAMIDSANPTGQSGTAAGTLKLVPPLTGAGVPVTSSHSVDPSAINTIWGNGPVNSVANAGKPTDTAAGTNLTCGSCHNPHGNGNYRILKPLPTGATEYSPGVLAPPALIAQTATSTPPLYTGVITDASVVAGVPDTTAADRTLSHLYTTNNYWVQSDAKAPAFISNVAEWCSTCHTRYLASSPSQGAVTASMQSRANSGDAIFTYRHTSSKDSRNCITCHVSHGSNAATGPQSSVLRNPDGSAAPGDQNTGDSRLLRIDNRGTCLMCHKP